MIYFIFFSMTLFILEHSLKQLRLKNNKVIFLTAFVILSTLLSGIRNPLVDVNSDIYYYYTNFQFISTITFFEVIEFFPTDTGYYLFIKLSSFVFTNPQLLLYLIQFIISYFIATFIFKYSDDVYLSTYIYLAIGTFLFSLTGFRQALAMVLSLIAFENAKNKRIHTFLFYTFLAFSFHRTAIITLPLYFLINLYNTKYKFLITISSFLVISTFFDNLFPIINEFLGRDYGFEEPESGLGGFINILFIAFPLLLYSYRIFVLNNAIDKKIFIFGYITLINLILYSLRFQVMPFERISMYFSFAVYIFLPLSINKFKFTYHSIKSLFRILLSITLLLLFIYRIRNFDFNVLI